MKYLLHLFVCQLSIVGHSVECGLLFSLELSFAKDLIDSLLINFFSFKLRVFMSFALLSTFSNFL